MADLEVTCWRCKSVFELENNLILPGGILVECSECSHIFTVHPQLAENTQAAPSSASPPPVERQETPKGPEPKGFEIKKQNGLSLILPSSDQVENAIKIGELEASDEVYIPQKGWTYLSESREFSQHFKSTSQIKSQSAELFDSSEEPISLSSSLEHELEETRSSDLIAEKQKAPVDEDFFNQKLTPEPPEEDFPDDDLKQGSSKLVWVFLLLLLAGGGYFFYDQNPEIFGGTSAKTEKILFSQILTGKPLAELPPQGINKEKYSQLRSLSLISALSFEIDELKLAKQWYENTPQTAAKKILEPNLNSKITMLGNKLNAFPKAKDYANLASLIKIHAEANAGKNSLRKGFKKSGPSEFSPLNYRLKFLKLIEAKGGNNLKKKDWVELGDILDNISYLSSFEGPAPPSSYQILRIHVDTGLGKIQSKLSLAKAPDGPLKKSLVTIFDIRAKEKESFKLLNQDPEAAGKKLMEEDKKKLSKKTSPKARGDKSKDKKKAKKGKKANFALYTKLLKKANKALDNGSTKSCKLFNKALSHNSKGVKAYIGLGWCNLDQNNLKNAEKFFKKAKVISPSFSEAYWGLAEVYGAMGKNPWKKIWCKQYLKIAPNGEFKGQAKNCIR